MKKSFSTLFFLFLAYFSFSQDTVVFVCEHGAARSTIAAAYFNKLAQQQGLNYRAVFRGTNPDSALNAAAKKGLITDGFEVQGWKPAPAGKRDLENAYRVITLDCILPETQHPSKPVTQWKGIPSISADYNSGRDSIVKKVQALVAELAQKNNRPGH
jgi:arsenate reductase